MTEDARRRAEACFATARGATTNPGERDNAIRLGTRIAQAAGLDLDSFDIPGRTKLKVPASRFADDLFTRPRSPLFTRGFYSPDEIEDVTRRFREHIEATAVRAQKAKEGKG